MRNSKLLYVVLTSILLIVWATAFVAIRHALESFSPANLAFLRYLIASVSFVVVAFFKKFKIPDIKDIPGCFALGLLGIAAYNLLLNYGEQTVDAGLASFIINTSPFIAVIWVAVTKQEKLANSDWGGLILSFIGVAIIIFSSNRNLSLSIDALLIFGAAVGQSIYFVLQKKMLQRYSPLELTAYAIWIGTVIMLFFTNKPFQELQNAKTEHILSLVFLGLLPGSIAYLIVAYILAKYKMSSFASYLFLVPFIALFIGYLFLGEIPGWIALGGGLLIVVGILIKNKLLKIPGKVAKYNTTTVNE